MDRRAFIAGAASIASFATWPLRAQAQVPAAYTPELSPPMDDKKTYVEWMLKNRGEDANYLGQRFDRFQALIAHQDVWDDSDKRAYLLCPREEFVTKKNAGRAYEWHFLDIGFGVTITGPHSVMRMTNVLGIKPGEKVLEIGTGSGYQSSVLSYLTDKVWTIEIIKPLFERTKALRGDLIARGYTEYNSIIAKNADGYYGWEDAGPFDKIIVTCGIDHVPPPLLQQMAPNGIMVIPVGPPGAQHVLKVVKEKAADGTFKVARSDIYHGSVVNFVPFTKLVGDKVSGTHSN